MYVYEKTLIKTTLSPYFTQFHNLLFKLTKTKFSKNIPHQPPHTPPPYQITHVVSRLKYPRGITLLRSHVGETERWGLYKQVSSLGGFFMRVINHFYVPQGALLVSLAVPVSTSADRSICEPQDRSLRCASAAAGPESWGTRA